MHELSLAQALVEQIIQAAAAENATRISKVVVLIGPLSGVDPDAFAAAFPFAAETTIAHRAELIIEEASAKAVCDHCHHEFSPDLPISLCEKCGSRRITVQQGREFLIRSIELELD